MADANIRAVITAKDEASAALRNFGNSASSIGNKIASVAKVASVALLATGAAATAFGVHAVKAFEDSENRIAQTNAVLASTKNIAGVTADEVTKLSKALEKQTTFSDEDVRSVENLLLTFTAITKDIFPQATKTVLNMATALGEDTKSASIQLGKALQDPVLGITALRRVGVNFNDAQKEVIKNLVETGHKAEAQQAILKELETEFGNSAEAARHTFGGSLKALKNQLNNVEEAVGGTITNALQPFIQKAADALASIDWDRVIRNTIEVLKEFGQRLSDIWQWFDKIYQQIEKYLKPKLEALWHSIQEAFPTFRTFIDKYINPLIEAFASVAGKSIVWAIGFVIDTLNALLKVATPVFQFLDDHRLIVEMLAGAFGALALKMALGAALDAITVGFATLQLVTIPSLIASLGALGTAFAAAMPYAAIAAFVVWFADQMHKISSMFDQISGYKTSLSNDALAMQKQAKADFAAGKITKAQLDKINAAANSEADYAASLSNPKKKAMGGSITAGMPYLVGEQGPEMVIPSQSGTVIPNNRLSSNTPINITFSGLFMGTQQEFRQLAIKLSKSLDDAKGMGTL